MAEKVVVQLVLDTSKYTANAQGAARSTAKIQGAADKTSKSMGGLRSTALKAGVALGAAFAAKAALDFAKSSIAAFSNLEESINAIEVAYGEAAEGIFVLGENSAEQFGLSTRAVNEAAVAMSAFASKIDAADPADAFENVLQRATDFASVMNIDVEESLLLFRSGLAGESEPLRKFGIDVSAATVNLVGLEAGLGGANGKLDEGEKVQARYLAIMQQTEKTAGDFANTADGLANSQRILSAKWEEAQVLLGKKLAPAMTSLISAGTKLLPVFGLIVDIFGDLVITAQPTIDLMAELAGIIGEVSGAASEGEDTAGGLAIEYGVVKDAVLTALFPLKDLQSGMADVALEMLGAGEEASGLGREFEALDTAARGISLGPVAAGVGDVTEAQAAGRGVFLTYNTALNTQATAAAGAAAAEEARAAGIRSALRAQAEAASPALRLLRAQESRVEAEEKLQSVREDSEATMADERDAILGLVEAQVDLRGAQADVSGVLGETVDAMFETGKEAGLLDAELIILARTFRDFPTSLNVDLNISRSLTTFDERAIAARFKRHGGPVAAGEPFIVGEAGPELFIPDQAGRIIPNKGVGGGQSIVVNVNDSTTTDLAADLSAGLIAAQITQQVEMLQV